MEGKKIQWAGWARKIRGQRVIVVQDGTHILVFLEGRQVARVPSPPATLTGIRRALSRP
jgi:hypothetical protein